MKQVWLPPRGFDAPVGMLTTRISGRNRSSRQWSNDSERRDKRSGDGSLQAAGRSIRHSPAPKTKERRRLRGGVLTMLTGRGEQVWRRVTAAAARCCLREDVKKPGGAACSGKSRA